MSSKIRVCRKCETALVAEENWSKYRALKRHNICNTCYKEYQKTYHEANKAKRNKQSTKNYQDNKDVILDKMKYSTIWNKYTLSKNEYLFLVEDGECFVCKETENLCIDHDHYTGEIRGVLCSKCNLGLGLLGDTLQSIENIRQYLLESTSNFEGLLDK
jgi:predicted Fe-S protein YdhL (DUF1289 family)